MKIVVCDLHTRYQQIGLAIPVYVRHRDRIARPP